MADGSCNTVLIDFARCLLQQEHPAILHKITRA